MKKVGQLTLKDFESRPVWTWADNDEDIVCPIEKDISEVDAIFVLVDLRFNNGAQTKGFAAIRVINKQVYSIAIADSTGSFIDVPLSPELKTLVDLSKLEKAFSLKIGDIFQIKFSTKSLAVLGKPIEGLIKSQY